MKKDEVLVQGFDSQVFSVLELISMGNFEILMQSLRFILTD